MSAKKDDGVTPREVNALKKLANTNFTKFTVAVQHVSAEVQMKVIEQLPEFRKLATDAVETVSNAFDSTLKSIQPSEEHVHTAHQEWRAALISMLEQPDLTLDEKLRITAEIGETVKGQATLHSEGTKAKVELFGKVVIGVVSLVGLVVLAVTGGKFAFDQEDSDNNA